MKEFIRFDSCVQSVRPQIGSLIRRTGGKVNVVVDIQNDLIYSVRYAECEDGWYKYVDKRRARPVLWTSAWSVVKEYHGEKRLVEVFDYYPTDNSKRIAEKVKEGYSLWEYQMTSSLKQ